MKLAKETWIQGQCQEVEACLRKNNSKKAYHLVKDLTMVLGSFQCRGILLLLHIVGQGPAVLAVGAGPVGGYIFYIFHLSSLSNVLSFGRRLSMTEILWFRLLNPKGSCQLLPRSSATINCPAQHDLVVDWAIKLKHKENKGPDNREKGKTTTIQDKLG